jgi:plasmid replication initiation protein
MTSQISELMQSKTPKAYKNKKLNNANFGDFSHTDYQVFLHLVSKIGGVDKLGKYLQPEQLGREHILTAKEFSEVFNTPLSHSYGILKKAVDKLMKTDIRVEKIERMEKNEDEEKIKSKRRIWRINVCSQAEYNENEGKITVEFTDRIMPYLAQVRQKFVLKK